jgi:hypothetical protein
MPREGKKERAKEKSYRKKREEHSRFSFFRAEMLGKRQKARPLAKTPLFLPARCDTLCAARGIE